MPRKQYACPRCNYSTMHKPDMHHHLYKRKTDCPNENNLTLTDEIKKVVLVECKYHPPTKATTASTINNYNTMYNFIIKMDPIDKLTKLLEYGDKYLTSFAICAEHEFDREVRLLKANKYRNVYRLDEHKLYEIVDTVTKIKGNEYDTVNNLYDAKKKRIHLFMNDMWSSFLTDTGINRVIEIIRDAYLYEYEFYLIKKIHNPETDAYSSTIAEKYLEEYYSFIAIFELEPSMRGDTDQELVGLNIHEKNPYHISEKCGELYRTQKGNLTKTKITAVKKQMIDIIRTNTIHKVGEINKKITDLMCADGDFKEQIMAQC